MDIQSKVKLIFVGATWNGSSARSLRDALFSLDGIELDDIGEDHYSPKGRSLVVRGMNRLMSPVYKRELAAEILRRCHTLKPDVVVVYKGGLVTAATVSAVQAMGIRIVNVYPDCSPHAFGKSHRETMGAYDLVISTKPFHPELWESTYGFTNPCVCVPHGFDPKIHFWPESVGKQDIDVAMVATWRPEYQKLMVDLSRLLPDLNLSVVVAGNGWGEHRSTFPANWRFPGPVFGRAYGELVRQSKVVISPVQTEIEAEGHRYPGDQDTTRTYELAAMGAFFLHRRTPFATQLYQEDVECGFWDDAKELAEKIRYYLPLDYHRREMAAAAHARAVPAYSLPARAEEVISCIQNLLEN